MEVSLSQDKTLNKEQQEVLRSKPSVVILIDELEKLPAPLSQEITLATHHHHHQRSSDVVKDTPELEDLVNLLYFGSLFDVKSQNELATGLERCIEHAKLWLANSDQPIASKCNVSLFDAALREKLKKIMGSNYFIVTPEMVGPVEATAPDGNYCSFQLAGDSEHKEEDTSNHKEEESVVSDQFEQPKLIQEGEVVHGHQEQAYTQVEGGMSNRDYQQQYVPCRSHQNQRGHLGARRGHSKARGSRGGGGGGYSNGRYESYDIGGNGYQRSYYNNKGKGRGGGRGGNGHSYNHHQDSNVTVAS
ncbi:hypothetical protein Bca4012_056083 [Brassica carinata]|uniref:Uncharacterized protein n=1 Tax=Brassica carinata TaxID=52824 RepID=A0A8X8B340_BRACI|nr:hypothetical protein Bca52824_014103 [Brassica carinata]